MISLVRVPGGIVCFADFCVVLEVKVDLDNIYIGKGLKCWYLVCRLT